MKKASTGAGAAFPTELKDNLMSFRPDYSIQKAILSTSSRLVGEYESDDLLITHVSPALTGFLRYRGGPAFRTALMLIFQADPPEKGSTVVLPDYSPIGNVLTSYLSVLFGKRFEHHGLIEDLGLFRLPDLSTLGTLYEPALPHNSHAPRVDYPIPLNLSEVARIEPLLSLGSIDLKFLHTFQIAAKFYLQALHNFEREPEISYLHLITAGEVLANFPTYEKGSLLDEQTKGDLEEIRNTAGQAVANRISGKLLLIRKRFVRTICDLVDSDFFGRSECKDPIYQLKFDGFSASVSSAYELRSKYVHAGFPFGSWATFSSDAEVFVGRPVVGDKKLSKILSRAPTLIGLERIIRYCLLRFAEEQGGYIETEIPGSHTALVDE